MQRFPMKVNKLLAVILFANCHLTHGQSDVCECCAYNSLKFKSEFTGIFPPDLIQKQKIHHVTIYTETSDASSKTTAPKYLEMKFTMDGRGQVTSKTEYNRRGKPHAIYEFERNPLGYVMKETFTYLDSLERKSTGLLAPEVIDYTYDQTNKLTKTKERDSNGNIVLDQKSNYSTFRYDSKGRLIKETRQYYYEDSDPETSIYTTVFNYFDDKLAGKSKTYENKKLFLTTKVTYNKVWKPVKEDGYNNLMSKPSSNTIYKYDSKDRLIYFSTKAGEGSGSECPDGGTFTETYKYDNKGLLSKIVHSFGENKCIMTFEYN